MKIDLESMTLAELRALKNSVSKTIASFEDRRKKRAVAELEDKAKEMGFTLSELMGVSIGRKRAPAVPKYADPKNPGQTWSGRGRKPRWFSDAIDAGMSAKDMEI